MKDASKIIYEFLEKFGLTPCEFSDLCGICHATIYNILNNTYQPTVTTCLKIEQATKGFIKYSDLTDKELNYKRRWNIKRREQARIKSELERK